MRSEPVLAEYLGMRKYFFKAAAVGVAIMAVVLASAGIGSAAAETAVVGISDGQIAGTVTADHRSFAGIPYAAPPVGALRWRPPRPPRPWLGKLDATRPGPPCAQAGFSDAGQPAGMVGVEDCLTLNVTTPLVGLSGLPVLVFVHGGGFVGGSGGLYDPTRIVTQGLVVVVTVNYRLGALGFLDHPNMDDLYAGNFGLADQQAALRWVRRNIAAFGGNPRNVTLWGESAGAKPAQARQVSERQQRQRPDRLRQEPAE